MQCKRVVMSSTLALIVVFCNQAIWAEQWILAKFEQDTASSFLPYQDWHSVIYHPQNVDFILSRNQQVSGLSAKPSSGHYQTYMGIEGESTIAFRRGHKILATFYNDTDQKLRLQARISFTDADEPGDQGDPNTPWFTMYSENATHDDFVKPGTFHTLVYNISDATSITNPGQPASEGDWRRVNISIDPHWNAWHGAFILTEIELSDEADITPPPTPANAGSRLIAATQADAGNSVVELFWDRGDDTDVADKPGAKAGLNRFLIFRDDKLYAVVHPDWVAHHGEQTVYRDLAAIPGQTHVYKIYAVDSAVTGHYRVPGSDNHFGNESYQPATVTVVVPPVVSQTLINPHVDFKFLGAFRLPRDYADNTSNFNYAFLGLTHAPGGNPNRDVANELPGSLYAVGNQQWPQLSQIDIPYPVKSNDPNQLPRATFVRPWSSEIWPQVYVDANGDPSWLPPGGSALPGVGIGYHPGVNGVGEGIYYGIYNWYLTGSKRTHGWVDLSLQDSLGAWRIHDTVIDKDLRPSLTDRFVFAVPQNWADTYTGGKSLIVGQGYQSGGGVPSRGTALYAIAPWQDGALPGDSAAIDVLPLIKYCECEDPAYWMTNWDLSMGFSGAVWVEAGNKAAVAVAVSRPMGDTWYGNFDGSVTFTSDLDWPPVENTSDSHRGPHATEREISLLFYNTADLAAVATGEMPLSQPQPYMALDLKHLLLTGPDEREPNLGAIAFDQANGFLYLIQSNADTSDGDQNWARRSAVYVWKVGNVDEWEVRTQAGSNTTESTDDTNPTNDTETPTESPTENEVATPEPAPGSGFVVDGSSCHLDADGNLSADPETDGYLIYRLMANYDDAALIEGRVGANASRTTAGVIRNWYQSTFGAPDSACHLDVDGDGVVYSDTDGFMVYRWLEGKTGIQLTNGITAAALRVSLRLDHATN